ncbi:DUF4232 domain-containing protein [Streptomyces sp. NPDC005279]|uniref:DUF4232 domain-containing protein n=1 Tax=Streptomyces sp. NPDC005279 TaxID=3364712 RepID=UPI0036A00B2F
MQHRNGIRRAVMAAVAASAATLLVAGCQPGDGETGAAGSPTAAGASSGGPDSAASKPADGGASAVPAASASPAAPGSGSGSPGEDAPTCAVTGLKAAAYQAAVRPEGTGIGAAVVEFANTSGHACTLQGHPTVAGAGNGSPQRNTPLAVTRTGSASPVRLAPGGKAWVKLTFVQVQGEGDGYCKSGSEPVAYPTLVVGLPGSGMHQVALEDGLFAECDNKVTVTAVTAAKPS